MLVAYGAMPALPVAVPVITAFVLAGTGYAVVKRWSTGPGWHDLHRLALVFGALVASMLLGFEVLIASGVAVISVDFIGKLGLNCVAVFWLVSLTGKLQRRAAQTADTP